MRRELAAIIVGLGTTIVSVVLPYAEPAMPPLVAHVGLVAGALILLVGLIMFFWHPRKEGAKGVQKASPELQDGRRELRHNRFAHRAVHLEYRINANADVVMNFLLQNYTGIAHMLDVDKSSYVINAIEAFNPSEHDVFQYGLIAKGYREILAKERASILGAQSAAVLGFEEIPEMFFITISQGQRDISVLSFDTDMRDMHQFTVGLVRTLGTAFKVELIH